jgi:hypothetical protein
MTEKVIERMFLYVNKKTRFARAFQLLTYCMFRLGAAGMEVF